MKLVLALTPLQRRLWMLNTTLPNWLSDPACKDIEVYLIDTPEQPITLEPKTREMLQGGFAGLHHMRVDPEEASFPVMRSPASFLLNVFGKFLEKDRPDVDAFLWTHPECLLFQVFSQCNSVYDPEVLVLFEAWKTESNIWDSLKSKDMSRLSEKEVFELDGVCTKPIVHPKIAACFWWYTVMVPVVGFNRIGGLDERLLQGNCGDDDQFCYCWMNSGRVVGISSLARVVHLWHPEFHTGVTEAMITNWEFVEEYKYNTDKIHSNEGREWGDQSSIVFVKGGGCAKIAS